MEKQTYSTTIGEKTLTAEFSDLTGRAHGSVILKLGETVVLVTAVMGTSEQTGMGYFPLSVEYEEKFYASGQILGSRFMRREGRPSDNAVLSARIVDRTIRPLFNHALRYDVQVIVTVLALGEDDPDTLGVIGASLALSVSDIPWSGPVGATRIGKKSESGELVVNPTYIERETGALSYEVLACSKGQAINMVETAGFEVSESDVAEALETAVTINMQLEAFQQKIVSEIGRKKRLEPQREVPQEMNELFATAMASRLTKTLFNGTPGKEHISVLKKEWLQLCADTLADTDTTQAGSVFEEAINEELHRGAIEEQKRADGRGLDELRPLYAQAGGISPVLHGSGIFYRGETHILTALTLGGPDDSQVLDTIEEHSATKHFMHHYNFPPFSVGETGRVGGYNRRMIGHGALAEKALAPVIPRKTTFPYTIRLVSETMSSNGSSSMGSVCASSLALMDGGVPISRPVAGIASGLMMQSDTKYALLTDIQGPEDEHGDMDFKVAGTRKGITAIQMDVKVDGVPIAILREALEKARVARLQILDAIEAELAAPRTDISPRAPKILVLTIRPDQIGSVIGTGGKIINGIKDATGVEDITIEDDGTVFITGKNGTADRAAEAIASLTRVYEVGEKLEATITRIAPFGAFAKLSAHAEGLIHVSEIAPFRINAVEDALAVGDVVPVSVIKVEEGKIALSIKKADPEFAKKKGLTPPEQKGDV